MNHLQIALLIIFAVCIGCVIFTKIIASLAGLFAGNAIYVSILILIAFILLFRFK